MDRLSVEWPDGVTKVRREKDVTIQHAERCVKDKKKLEREFGI